MSKSRRNVRFQHRNAANSELRRLSVSDVSDAVSEPHSPSKNGSVSKSAAVPEEVRNCCNCCFHGCHCGHRSVFSFLITTLCHLAN